MTITDSDRDSFEDTKYLFEPQPTPDYCLPIGLKNILEELSDRHDVSSLSIPESELREITDYETGMASTSENVAAVLGSELEDVGYTVKEQVNTTLSELDDIIQRGTASYPLVELSSDYFELIENWDPQPGRRGYSYPHVVTPYKINTNELLYYDPFEEMMARSGRVSSPPKDQLTQPKFFKLWNNGPHPRWTMWVEQLEQQTLQASIQRNDS